MIQVLLYLTTSGLFFFLFFFFVDAVDASPPDDEELVYSQPEDGKPKPIPVNEFPSYYKQKSENGAIVLRDEFKVRYVMPLFFQNSRNHFFHR